MAFSLMREMHKKASWVYSWGYSWGYKTKVFDTDINSDKSK